MEPITMVLNALVAGAAATAGTELVSTAVKDAYAGLKGVIVRKFGKKADIENALAKVEKRPESDGRKTVLKEELETAEIVHDEEVLRLAQGLLDLLKAQKPTGSSYQAFLKGDGAISQGNGAVSAGKGGVAIGGNVEGGVHITRSKERAE